MIVLFRNQETACLNELTNRFPELLAQSQINLSSHGQQILLEFVKSRIKSNYFPTLGDNLSTLFGAILLVPLFVMAVTNKAVSTLDTHSEERSTPELKSITDGKINLLDSLIHTHILDHYRDHAKEARIAADVAQRRTNQPQLTQYTAHRTNIVARREERAEYDTLNRSLSLLCMSLYFIAVMLIFEAMSGARETAPAVPNTYPAPRF